METNVGVCKNCSKNKVLVPLGCSHQFCYLCLSSIYAQMMVGLFKELCSGVNDYQGWTAKLGCPFTAYRPDSPLFCPEGNFKVKIKDLKYLINRNPEVSDDDKNIINFICKAPCFQEIPTWFRFCQFCKKLGWSQNPDYNCEFCLNCILCSQIHQGQPCSNFNPTNEVYQIQYPEFINSEPAGTDPHMINNYIRNSEIEQPLAEILNQKANQGYTDMVSNHMNHIENNPKKETIERKPIKRASKQTSISNNPRKNILNIIGDEIKRCNIDNFEISEFTVYVDIEEKNNFNKNRLKQEGLFYEDLMCLSNLKKEHNCIALNKGFRTSDTIISSVMRPMTGHENWYETQDAIYLPSRDFLLTKYSVSIARKSQDQSHRNEIYSFAVRVLLQGSRKFNSFYM